MGEGELLFQQEQPDAVLQVSDHFPLITVMQCNKVLLYLLRIFQLNCPTKKIFHNKKNHFQLVFLLGALQVTRYACRTIATDERGEMVVAMRAVLLFLIKG